MKARSAPRAVITMVSTAIVAVLGVLGSNAPASAEPDVSARCSNETLFGRYGSSSEGVLLLGPSFSLEFRGLTVTRFDGHGNLTWREHTVVGGVPEHPGWITATGAYTVNADCTGSMTVTSPNSPEPLNLFMVVVKRGREVRTLLDAHAILSVFTKVD